MNMHSRRKSIRQPSSNIKEDFLKRRMNLWSLRSTTKSKQLSWISKIFTLMRKTHSFNFSWTELTMLMKKNSEKLKPMLKRLLTSPYRNTRLREIWFNKNTTRTKNLSRKFSLPSTKNSIKWKRKELLISKRSVTFKWSSPLLRKRENFKFPLLRKNMRK